jgi:hypothetical protein
MANEPDPRNAPAGQRSDPSIEYAKPTSIDPSSEDFDPGWGDWRDHDEAEREKDLRRERPPHHDR